MYCLSTDMRESGVWCELAKLQDPELRRLAESLTEMVPELRRLAESLTEMVPELRRLAESLTEMVIHSRVDSTTRKYMYAFQRWKSWAEVAIFPIQEVHFALYL